VQINSSIVKVLRGGQLTPLAWRDVVVGDIVRVRCSRP
jgi:magnesium-transporting ATPase (P-type)